MTEGTWDQTRTKGSDGMERAKTGLANFSSAIARHRILTLAGSLAYTTALALAPFVLIILAFASLLGQKFQNQMYAQLTSLLGGEAGDAVKIVVENADNNQSLTTISGIVGLVILAVSASAVFAGLRSALDIINETPEDPQSSGVWGFFRERFLSMGLVFGFVFLAITSLTVTALLSNAFAGSEKLLWSAISFIANVCLFASLFTCMFRFIPTEKLSWRGAVTAGLCATAFFLIGKTLIGIYLGNAAVGSAYGAAGTFVVFLVWVYYTTATLLISYEFATNVFIKGVPHRE